MLREAMLKRLKSILGTNGGKPSAITLETGDLQLAAAALLVEAAVMDGNIDDDERRTILGLLEQRFELSSEDAVSLIDDAIEVIEQSSELYGYTRTIKDNFEHDERVRMIEMLWEVAYADGQVDEYESNLVRRVAGLIYVSDVESGSARKRAMKAKGN